MKHTCEARDPVRRWTDDCPPPVLAVACLVGSGSVILLVVSLARLAVVPFFGILLSGLPGMLLMLALAVGLAWIARSWYRLDLTGWWALVAVVVASSISNTLTFARVDIAEVYRRLGYQQSMIDMIQRQGWFTGGFMRWASLAWVLPMLGYLLWVKRFFRVPRPTAAG